MKVKTPPKWLSAHAQSYWRRVSGQYPLTRKTYDLLAIGAEAYATYREAIIHLNEEGWVVQTPTGRPIPSPWVLIQHQVVNTLRSVQRDLSTLAYAAPPVEAEVLFKEYREQSEKEIAKLDQWIATVETDIEKSSPGLKGIAAQKADIELRSCLGNAS